MPQRYDPPEEKINRVLETYSPRQIAIAYLRASHRARQAEKAFELMDSLQGATAAAATGDFKGANAGLQDMLDRLRRK